MDSEAAFRLNKGGLMGICIKCHKDCGYGSVLVDGLSSCEGSFKKLMSGPEMCLECFFEKVV